MVEPVVLLDGRVTLYVLRHGETGEVRYAGKTQRSPSRRLTEHVQASKRSQLPVGRWVKKQVERGIRPVLDVVEIVEAGGDWASREKFWIDQIPSPRRLNLTDGGEGLAGHLFAGTEHARKIAAAMRTGAAFSCETCGQEFWRRRSEIDAGNARFCSRPCYALSRKGISKPVSLACKERGLAAAAAKRAAQTHCKRGHELSGPNVFRNSAGSRGCRECRKIHKLTYRRRIAHG